MLQILAFLLISPSGPVDLETSSVSRKCFTSSVVQRKSSGQTCIPLQVKVSRSAKDRGGTEELKHFLKNVESVSALSRKQFLVHESGQEWC